MADRPYLELPFPSLIKIEGNFYSESQVYAAIDADRAALAAPAVVVSAEPVGFASAEALQCLLAGKYASISVYAECHDSKTSPLYATPVGPDAVDARWQPIETAPKDEVVLVYTPPQPDDWPDSVRIAFDYICPDYEDWHDHCSSYEHYMAVGGPGACGPDVVCTGPSEKAPYTHWMRLPAIPALASTPSKGAT